MQSKWWFITLVVAVLITVSAIASGCGIEQKRQRAGLQITTVAASAAAYLNGTYLNRTPLIEKNLRPGTYTVRLVAEDTALAPYEDQITLHAGTLSTLTWKPASRTELSSSIIYQLEPQNENQPFWKHWFTNEPSKTTGELKIVSLPDNAIVNLTELADRQFAPFVFTDLPAGKIDYSVFLPSYETHQHTLDIKAGFRTTAIIKLAKNPPQSGETESAQVETQTQVLGAQASESAKIELEDRDATLSAQPGEKAVLILATGFRENGEEVLRVRSQPDKAAPIIGAVQVGKRLPYAGETVAGWYRVYLAKQPGWVNQLYAQLEPASSSATRQQ